MQLPDQGLIFDPAQPSNREGAQSGIRTHYAGMSASFQKIADYILTSPQQVIYQSITELAEAVGVGEATVSRFCRMVGFSGFQELKMVLAQEVSPAARAKIISPEDKANDTTQTVVNHTIRVAENTTQFLNEDDVDKAVDLLLKAPKVLFLGVGSSGTTATDAMLEFARIGINCTSYPDPHIQTINAALLGADDVAVIFSHSGSTKDMLSAARAVKASGANLICVTSSFRSPISKIADVILLASVGESTVVSSFCPKIGQLIILERLFAGCIKKMGKEAQERINRTTHAILDKMY